MSAPAWSPGAMTHAHPAYRAGWEYAKAELADAPQHVREAAARHMDGELAAAPVNTPQSYALMGGLAYLQQRHERNQDVPDIE